MTAPPDAEVRALLDAGAHDRATELALRAYGAEILGWLHGTSRSEVEASDAFALFAEDLWKSLRRWDGRCSARTWCYMLARHAASRVRENPAAARAVPISQAPVAALAEEIRASTLPHLRTTIKDRVRELRRRLEPDDQHLLVLRVDRDLGWRDISQILLGDTAGAADVDRHAAALRKRFERVKQRLRELASEPP